MREINISPNCIKTFIVKNKFIVVIEKDLIKEFPFSYQIYLKENMITEKNNFQTQTQCKKHALSVIRKIS